MGTSHRVTKGTSRAVKVAVPTVALLGFGSIAYAATAGSPGTINGCVARSNGQLRIDNSCRRDERPITWNAFGPTGPAGQQGPVGAQGPAGQPGAAGAPGSPGAAGPVGPTGDAGAQGAAGANGAPGADGAPGAPGATGADGAPGAPGADGAPGPTGPKGDIGPAGAPGHDATGAVALACDTLAATKPAGAAATNLDILLELDGIPGSSNLDKHSDAIDLASFCWGADVGADAGTFSVEKSLDHATTELLGHLESGATIGHAKIFIINPALGVAPLETIVFSGVTVHGQRIGGHATGVDEDVSFAWTDAEVTFPGQTTQTLHAPAHTSAETQPRCLNLTSTDDLVAGSTVSYLEIAGITGGSVADKHKGAMDVGALCFGASAAGSIDAGGHPRAAAAAGDVSMWKRADIASSDLYRDYLAGTTYPAATITSFRTGGSGGAPQRTITLALSGASIDGLRVGARAGVLNEDLSLSWASMTVSVYIYNGAGGLVGTDSVTIAR